MEDYSIVTYANGQEQSTTISRDDFMVLKEQSETVKNMFKDLGNQERVITLPPISHNDFSSVLPLLKKVHNGIKPELLQQELITYNAQTITKLINNVNYLDNSTLLKHSITAFVSKIRTLFCSVNDFKQDGTHSACFSSLPLEIQKQVALKSIDNIFEVQKIMAPYITCKKSNPPLKDGLTAIFNNIDYLLESAHNENYTSHTKSANNQWSAGVLPNNKTQIKNITHKTVTILDTDQYKDQSLILSVVLSLDGKLLATEHNDHTIKIWDIAHNRDIIGFTNSSNKITCVASTQDDKYLAIAEESTAFDIIKIWNTQTNKQTLEIFDPGRINCLALNSDGTSLAIGRDNDLYIVNSSDASKPYYGISSSRL